MNFSLSDNAPNEVQVMSRDSVHFKPLVFPIVEAFTFMKFSSKSSKIGYTRDQLKMRPV
jgi:hypothetical protein